MSEGSGGAGTGGERQQEWRSRAHAALAGGVSSNTRLLNPHLIAERAAG